MRGRLLASRSALGTPDVIATTRFMFVSVRAADRRGATSADASKSAELEALKAWVF